MADEVEVRVAGQLLVLTIHRPEKHNAIDVPMLERLVGEVERFSGSDSLSVLLLRARGRYFSSGADVKSGMFPDLEHASPARFRSWAKQGHTSLARLADLVAACEKPTIVAHQGPCLGGALELSLAFDFRVASSAAQYALPETRFGAVPVTGGVSRLTRIVGPSWARWLLVAGETVDAAKAERIGLIHAVHDAETFDAEVDALCARLLAMPPEAASAAKLAIDLAEELGTAGGRNVERIVASSLVFGAEYQGELAKVLERLNRSR